MKNLLLKLARLKFNLVFSLYLLKGFAQENGFTDENIELHPIYDSKNQFFFSLEENHSQPDSGLTTAVSPPPKTRIQNHPTVDFEPSEWQENEDSEFVIDTEISQQQSYPLPQYEFQPFDDSHRLLNQNISSIKVKEIPSSTLHPLGHPGAATEETRSTNKPSLVAQVVPPPAENAPVQPPQTTPNILSPPPESQEKQAPSPTVNQVPEHSAVVSTPSKEGTAPPKTILINFNNVSIIEYLHFISRISNKNFIFDENDLQFTVTIISEEPTTIENVMTALMQELRIHDLSMLNQGDNIIIHKNPKVGTVSPVVDDQTGTSPVKAEIITKVFRLNTIEAEKAASLLKPLVSSQALVEALKETNHLIITDLSANIKEITHLLKSIDAPQSGLVIGQYVVRNAFMDTLIVLGEQIIHPIAGSQSVIFVPHAATNSIFIVSTPFLVERTISILQYLDQNQGTTRILTPQDLSYQRPAIPGIPTVPGTPGAAAEVEGGLPPGAPPGVAPGAGQWMINPASGLWEFHPEIAPGISTTTPPEGRWIVDPQGNWYFQPGLPPSEFGPEGKWALTPQGIWVFQLSEGKSISPERLTRAVKIASELPVGHIQRTQFYIHKLRYRNGDQIAHALNKIAESLHISGTSNIDLISAINSTQWLEGSNSLVFTGTPDSLDKIRELVEEIDTPLRQVFLEMLILELTLTDALDFSVNLGERFGGGLVAGVEEFVTGASTLNNGFLDAIGPTGFATPPPPLRTFVQQEGFTWGVIGIHLTHRGNTFATLGALVRALHNKTNVQVITNPKILTEDNSPAEIFVGINTQYPTQAIANNEGSIVTQNFEYRDVGVRLKVTPLISNNDIITLEIQEEISRAVPSTVNQPFTNTAVGPTTTVNRTTTRVHMPNKYFLVLSGNLQDVETHNRKQVPCLGSIPILGALLSDKHRECDKTNLMIFIRPEIIDTVAQIQDLTKRQQNIWRVKKRRPSSWKFETDEALDFLNLEDTEDPEGEKECY